MARYTVYLGLGSNLGDKHGIFDAALQALRSTAGIHHLRESTRRQTAPVGNGYTSDFLNSVIALDCDRNPSEMLRITQAIEADLGRNRAQKDRTIDLDILLVRDLQAGQWIAQSADPVLPHPRMHLRDFVLTPLREHLNDQAIAEALTHVSES